MVCTLRTQRCFIPLAVALTAIALFSLATVHLYTEKTAYSAGDWLKYRIYTKTEFMNVTFECDFTIRIDIEKVDDYSVTLTSSVESVKKESEVCRTMIMSFSGRSTIDVKRLDPEKGSLLVDPVYTGEYDINGIRAVYNKGVLTKLAGKTASMGVDLSIVIELVDTSIAELKGATLLSILVVVLIIVAVVGVTIAITAVVLRSVKKTATLTPATQPAQTPAQ